MEMRTDDMPFVASHLDFDARGAHGDAPDGEQYARGSNQQNENLTYDQ